MADILGKRPMNAEMTIFKTEIEPYKLNDCIDNILMRVDRLETKFSDAQPVKHGHWYHNTSKYISELDAYFIQACCSCCSRYSDRIDAYSQIMSNENCSHCGARMDLNEGDAE